MHQIHGEISSPVKIKIDTDPMKIYAESQLLFLLLLKRRLRSILMSQRGL